eukprot:gene12983-2584_t
MGASDVIDLSGLDPARPPGPTMQQVPQHQGGPGPQGPPRPMTEAERLQYMRMRQMVKQQQQVHARQQGGGDAGGGAMGTTEKEATAKANNEGIRKWEQQQKQKQLSLEQEKLRRVYMEKHASLWDNSIQSQEAKDKHRHLYLQNQAAKWDKAHQQGHPPYTASQAPQTAIPGLPNMFPDTRAPNGAGTSAQLPPGVKLAHASAVGQGLVGAETFGACRRSFLTWMAVTPMSQLSEQGTDLEQTNGIERRLLRAQSTECSDNAAYCLDLVKTLGFSWFSEGRAPSSMGASGPVSLRGPLIASAPQQPTTSPVLTAHAPATSPPTTAQGVPRSVSAGLEVGGSAGLEVGRETTLEMSRDAQGDGHPALGEVSPTQAVDQLAQGDVLSTQAEVQLALGDVHLTQAEVQLALGDVQLTQAEVQPAQGEVTPTLAEVQPAQGDVHPANMGVHPTPGGEQPTQGEAQAAKADVCPTQAGVQPAQEDVHPANMGVHPTPGGYQPTQKEAQPGQADVQPTPAEVQPAQGEVTPTQAEDERAQGDVRPTQVGVRPTQGGVQAEQVEVQPTQGGVQSTNSVPSLSAQADPQGQAGPQSHSPQGETEPVPQTISKAGEGVHEKEADVLVQDQGAPEAQADICSPSLPPT